MSDTDLLFMPAIKAAALIRARSFRLSTMSTPS